ncbi:hypothetical protein IKF63_00335 [Candidatus Saccharibacteria bacterium]|nr:hypothetical protein [Candidatus Saccharibacteria bacterium]
MVKTKNIVAALGVVAGIGSAALPLTTFADVTNPQSNTQVIRATVENTFQLSVTPNVTLTKTDISQTLAVNKDNENTDLEHVVEVKGNAYSGYTLTMGSNNAYDSLRYVADSSKEFGAAARYDDDVNIPASTSVQHGTSSWAYRTSTTPASDQSASIKGDYSSASWTKVKANSATADTLLSQGSSVHAAFDDKVYVNFGIATSETQPAGVYEGEVIYTATASF